MKLKNKILYLIVMLSYASSNVTAFAEGGLNPNAESSPWIYLFLIALVVVLIFQLIYPLKKYSKNK
ncbi:hypothetical protein [Clostridium sp. UBA5119]|uniref:hypothetical protein n=1 Tax=Clostridium sp. UBA5119 TaxID=1946366 RepID=UPI0032162D82